MNPEEILEIFGTFLKIYPGTLRSLIRHCLRYRLRISEQSHGPEPTIQSGTGSKVQKLLKIRGADFEVKKSSGLPSLIKVVSQFPKMEKFSFQKLPNFNIIFEIDVLIIQLHATRYNTAWRRSSSHSLYFVRWLLHETISSRFIK